MNDRANIDPAVLGGARLVEGGHEAASHSRLDLPFARPLPGVPDALWRDLTWRLCDGSGKAGRCHAVSTKAPLQ
eukprot:scaffold178654_cov47-Prasinocladus_malaysianus.AAC.1